VDKALEVLENTLMIALWMFGTSMNTANATKTISITYSTMVWPLWSLTNRAARDFKALMVKSPLCKS